MKTGRAILLLAAAFLSLTLFLSCATLRRAPDPARVQAQIIEYREQEIALVRATVVEQERAEQFIALLAERDRMVAEYAQRIKEHREKLAALTADYDAERTDFETLLGRFNRQRAAAQQESIELVAAMKAATTAKEWKIISRFQLKRFDLRELSYGTTGQGN